MANLKLAILISLVVLFGVLYYRAFILNQPCKHVLNPMREEDKIQLNDQIMNRLRKALTIKTISSFEHQNISAIVDFIKFIREG